MYDLRVGYLRTMNLGDKMREEFDIKNLNPRKNPYAKLVKKQVTILEISRTQIRYNIKKLQRGDFD